MLIFAIMYIFKETVNRTECQWEAEEMYCKTIKKLTFARVLWKTIKQNKNILN